MALDRSLSLKVPCRNCHFPYLCPGILSQVPCPMQLSGRSVCKQITVLAQLIQAALERGAFTEAKIQCPFHTEGRWKSLEGPVDLSLEG